MLFYRMCQIIIVLKCDKSLFASLNLVMLEYILSGFLLLNYRLFARSDTERLQSLTEKQAQDIAENMLYIKELEDRERMLAQNVVISPDKKCYGCLLCIPAVCAFFLIPSFYECKVEELLMEVKETEAEVARWREACELEVEAGKHEIKERDKVVKRFIPP